MVQITVYGRRANLDRVRARLSAAIHASVVETLALPPTKRFHRFIALDDADFIYSEIPRTTGYGAIATRSSRSACSRAVRWRRKGR